MNGNKLSDLRLRMSILEERLDIEKRIERNWLEKRDKFSQCEDETILEDINNHLAGCYWNITELHDEIQYLLDLVNKQIKKEDVEMGNLIEDDRFIDYYGNYSIELQDRYLEDLAQEYENQYYEEDGE